MHTISEQTIQHANTKKHMSYTDPLSQSSIIIQIEVLRMATAVGGTGPLYGTYNGASEVMPTHDANNPFRAVSLPDCL
ncbi:hypothetical protein V499_04800 [Pseudogymnoascus sp. VKM F-103]|nr:hypothetical protein V499_04800 [Pseudogymnoascus sp. VKM F-103]